MTISNNESYRQADDEAVEWILQLREEPDDPDVRARFTAWLSASPLNAQAWADTARAYDRAGEARPLFSAADGERPPRLEGRRRLTTTRRAVVALAAAACLVIAAAPGVRLWWTADRVTGTAELALVTLADGSTIQLAPGSAIAVKYGDKRRQVRLLKGEAWFDVQHDASRPFDVDAKGITTAVLGTAFDVKLDAEGATTALERGTVHMAYRAVTPPVVETLVPGDTVRVGFDGAVQRAAVGTSPGAWRDGRIIVEDRPAGEVVDALRPWFRGVIIAWNDELSNRRVTGVYDARDPAEALRGLIKATGGRVTRVTPWVIVLSDR